jgi:pentatricopeptide repeat protein
MDGTMMDIYAIVGNLDKAESIFKTMDVFNSITLSILIKAYGKCDKADQATTLFHEMLKDIYVELDLSVFNALIVAWATSSHSDAADQAFAVYEILERQSKGLGKSIRPNAVTFITLLKCLAESKGNDVGMKAVAILDSMESRFQAGDLKVKPHEAAFELAIKACLRTGDRERADAVRKRMKIQTRRQA